MSETREHLWCMKSGYMWLRAGPAVFWNRSCMLLFRNYEAKARQGTSDLLPSVTYTHTNSPVLPFPYVTYSQENQLPLSHSDTRHAVFCHWKQEEDSVYFSFPWSGVWQLMDFIPSMQQECVAGSRTTRTRIQLRGVARTSNVWNAKWIREKRGIAAHRHKHHPQ